MNLRTQAIADAMKFLNNAMCARKVYWAQHPSALTPLFAAASRLSNLLTDTCSVSIVSFEDRVVSGDYELPDGTALLAGLFGLLRARGAQSITFKRGVTAQELGELLGQLARKDATGPLISSTSIRLGCIGTAVEPPEQEYFNQDPAAQIPKLKSLWTGLMHKGVIDRGLLDSAASSISSDVKSSSESTILLSGLQSHEDYTLVHTTNVAILAAALGESLGLASPLIHDLTIAALLHDVGKRRVPREVLNKTSTLSPQEFNAVTRHPSDGAGMLFGIKHLPAIAAIVAYEHHMRPDGSGYPAVRVGRQMQLASQIVQIGDVFDALRSARPFRAGLSFEQTRAIMYQDVRRFYDPDLLDTFFATVARRAAHLESSVLSTPVPAALPNIPPIFAA